MLTGMDFDIESTEKRKLAEAPKVPNSLETLNKWPKAFELYFGDRLGFRQILIGVWSSLQYHLLGSSVSELVIVGEDGWLFYSEVWALEAYRRFKTLSDEELKDLGNSFALLNQWMECQNTKLLMVVAPNKSTIYPDKMPKRFNRNENQPVIDQIAETARSFGIAFVDVRDELKDARLQGEEVYYKTDTHWNSWGSYIAYKKITMQLSEWFPGITPIETNELSRALVSSHSGDLAIMHGSYPMLSETTIAYSVDTERKLNVERKPGRELPDPKLDFHIFTERSDGSVVIMFRDSFSDTLLPYIQNHFHTITSVWRSRIDPDLVEKERPQVVIVEVVERILPVWIKKSYYQQKIFQKEYGVLPTINTPSQTGRNIDDTTSLLGAVRVGTPSDKTGYITFGPYIKLSAGRHQVTFRAKVNALSEHKVATFDVAGNKGHSIFAKRSMTAKMFEAANKWQDITLDFTLNEAVSDAEFRVHYDGGANLAIDYIRHQALDDDPSPIMACMNKKLPWKNISNTWAP